MEDLSDVPIVATKRTRELIITSGAKEHRWFQAHSQERLSALEAKLDQEQEKAERRIYPK